MSLPAEERDEQLSSLRPIKVEAISDSVYDAIERAIVRGELEPRAPLSDRQLATTFNVSRTPVRDALRQLEASGLVRRGARNNWSGWVVADFAERDIRELFELRRVLEPVGLQKLFTDPGPRVVARLGAFFDDFPEQLPPLAYGDYLERDRQFHQAIVAQSGNSRLIGFYAILDKQIDRGRHFLATGAAGRIDSIHREHRALCTAIVTGSLETAIAALVHHLRTGEEAMIVYARQRGLLRETPAELGGGGDG